MRWIFYVIKNARDQRGLLYNEQALKPCSHYSYILRITSEFLIREHYILLIFAILYC